VIIVFLAFSSITVFAQTNKPEPMIPLYRDPPYYPRSAAGQGIEGWVHAKFDVLKDGTVDKSLIVILDEEPKGVFTRPAIQSAESFRFNPRLSDEGIPVNVTGVTYLFHFAFRSKATNNYFSDAYTGRPPPPVD
jgi:TonB family protein|tara:strand:- start:90 stop:491 length:402 start_codon:yes stop_codon:yes gene_type:complete